MRPAGGGAPRAPVALEGGAGRDARAPGATAGTMGRSRRMAACASGSGGSSAAASDTTSSSWSLERSTDAGDAVGAENSVELRARAPALRPHARARRERYRVG